MWYATVMCTPRRSASTSGNYGSRSRFRIFEGFRREARPITLLHRRQRNVRTRPARFDAYQII